MKKNSVKKIIRVNNKNQIFIANNLLILSFVFLKLVDFITTFQQLEYGDIFEANPFVVDLVQNPLLMYFLLFLYVSFLFMVNFLTCNKSESNEIQKILLFILIFSNLIGIFVLLYNYNVLYEYGELLNGK